MNKINPLNILKCRKTERILPHFAKIKIDMASLYTDEMDNWIVGKCSGRYCISAMPDIDQKGKLKSIWYAGFEDHKELTYFMLACQYLRRN